MNKKVEDYAKQFGVSKSSFCSMLIGQGVMSYDKSLDIMGGLKESIQEQMKKAIENCFRLLPRQALHAKTLGFVHPKTRQMVRFDSELPADMQSLIDKWRKYSENMTQFLEEED